jgi:hypothetical protein
MIWELAIGAITVAIIMVLVRPNSKGSTFITSFGEAFSGLITTAVGA